MLDLISLRFLDWFVTRYCYLYKININVNNNLSIQKNFNINIENIFEYCLEHEHFELCNRIKKLNFHIKLKHEKKSK